MTSPQDSSLGTIKKRSEGIEDMYRWGSQVTSLLTDLKYDVGEVVNTLQTFLRQDSSHFRTAKSSNSSTRRCDELLQEIMKSLTGLRKLLKELNRVGAKYKESQEDVSPANINIVPRRPHWHCLKDYLTDCFKFGLYLNVGSSQSICHQQWGLLFVCPRISLKTRAVNHLTWC